MIIAQEVERQEYQISEYKWARGASTPRPPSFLAISTAYGGRPKSAGAIQVSMLTLPPKQVQVLLRVQVGDPDEELNSAIAACVGALELDQSAFVFAESGVQSSLGPPPSTYAPASERHTSASQEHDDSIPVQ